MCTFLSLIKLSSKKDKAFHPFGIYKCICGKIKVIRCDSVNRLDTTSCGCKRRELNGESHRTHGMSKSAEFRAWQSMHTRCYNKKYKYYGRYGGRGISVCELWQYKTNNGFANFLSHVGKKPAGKYSLDRIDNNGNYEPGNVRWATVSQQINNRGKFKWKRLKKI